MQTVLFFLLLKELVFAEGIFLGGILPPQPVFVRTKVGQIYGKIKTIKFGKQYQVKEFLGIPYAEAPIGERRLRKPIPKSPFTSQYVATDYGASCLQPVALGRMVLSEDCLFLNVFVPGNVNVTQVALPVMVFIHGGDFISGTSTTYAGDNLSAFGKVIVVTLNYRLAHLGFLLTEAGASNFGLWDQHTAIKWVHDNIAAFGGDVNRITLFGQSAGSTSVIYQSLFSKNRNLFQRVIAQSGGITSSWAYIPYHTAKANFVNFTGELRCNCHNHTSVMACIRNKTTDEIAKVMKSPTLNYTMVHPNKDNDFIFQHPRFMMSQKTGSKESLDFFYSLDLLTGSTSADGALYLQEVAYTVNISDSENLRIPNSLYENFFIPITVSAIFRSVLDIPQIVKDAAVFEYTNYSCPNDDMGRNRMLVKLTDDVEVLVPSVTAVDVHTTGLNGRTYLYLFSVRPGTHLRPLPSWIDGPTQASHGDDLAFVFGFSDGMVKFFKDAGLQFVYTPHDIAVAKGVLTLWTNFAKSGNPNEPVSVLPYLPITWPEYYTSSQRYIDITPTMTTASVKQRLATKEVQFWNELLPSLIKYSK